MHKQITLKSIVVVSPENVSCALGDEAAILHMPSGSYFGLDPVGARVWGLLGEPRSVEELRETIVSEYDVQPAQCEDDLLSLLEKLHRNGLIEIRNE